MIPGLLESLALAFPIATATPGNAAPCPGYDPCENLDFWSSLAAHNAAAIPGDGVLVLQGAHRGGWDDHVLEHIDLEVTLDGQPIAGALTRSAADGVLVWRPEAPWTPGAPYQLHANVTNAIDVSGCAPASFEVAADLIVGAEPGGPIAAPTFTALEDHRFDPVVALENLACCEGEVPAPLVSGCSTTYLGWTPGACFAVTGVGTLRLDLTVTPAQSGPIVRQSLHRSIVDGQPLDADLALPGAVMRTLFASAPVCVAIEAQDLATDNVVRGPETCFGDAFADELGPRPTELPDSYHCQLQRCELTDGAWDLQRCTPLDIPVDPDSEPEGNAEEDTKDAPACGCDTSTAAGLGLLVLPALRRRRRSR